ncbi:MAG: PDZ domain-containing protein, partial [Thiohalospira sp.]
IEDDQGVLVAGVFRDGPAHAAGMRPGDVITAIEDEPLEGVESGLRRISELTPGDSVEVEGYRDGEPKSWDVEVARRPLPQR